MEGWTGCKKKRELGNTVARGVGMRVLWARLSEELQFSGERHKAEGVTGPSYICLQSGSSPG